LETRFGNRVLTPNQFLAQYIVDVVFRSCLPFQNASDRPRIERWLDRSARVGSLVLLVDELDQVAVDSIANTTLVDALGDSLFSKCPVVVAGRPYAIQDRWSSMFANRSWTYFQLDGFNTEQQKTFLKDRDGNDRYDELLDEVKGELKDILEVPRVLSYLRELDLSEFKKIRTPSDVYLRAIFHMVKRGLSGNHTAAQFGHSKPHEPIRKGDSFNVSPELVAQAVDVLAAMAWEMLWLPASAFSGPVKSTSGPYDAPNFNQVQGVEATRKLTSATLDRLTELDYYSNRNDLRTDLNRLKSMNEALERAVIDSSLTERLLWRNRSLQEFLAAYCLCRMSPTQADRERLWRWVYLPHQPKASTEAFYWIWRFAAEMDIENQHAVVRPDAWVQSMAPLYRPGNGNAADTKRSTELIYRTWNRMETWGPETLQPFLDEFQSILDGKQGGSSGPRATRAREFQSLFITVPENRPFRMGTPRDKQGIPAKDRPSIQAALDAGREDPDRFIRDILNARETWISDQPERNREALREEQSIRWRHILDQGIDEYERKFCSIDETPSAKWANVPVLSFQLNAFPTLRSWYALFDPGHGDREEAFAGTLSRVAPTEDHPVFFVAWYDAWAFCNFAHWNGQSCRLPHEDEWEKAAKAQRQEEDWHWRFWWGDDEQAARLHCTFGGDSQAGISTSPKEYRDAKPGSGHKNWLGFVDILGNQWEWTDDPYRWEYSQDPNEPSNSTSRVLRGGAWNNGITHVRCSVRNFYRPTNLDNGTGFRVSRALEIS
jgi:hypothetical protein